MKKYKIKNNFYKMDENIVLVNYLKIKLYF